LTAVASSRGWMRHRGQWLGCGAQLSAAVRWHTMKRTTVKLPDELDARLRHEAERRGMTVSDLTRQAIETHLVEGGKRRLGAAGRSGRSDVSQRIEEILRSELAAR